MVWVKDIFTVVTQIVTIHQIIHATLCWFWQLFVHKQINFVQMRNMDYRYVLNHKRFLNITVVTNDHAFLDL